MSVQQNVESGPTGAAARVDTINSAPRIFREDPLTGRIVIDEVQVGRSIDLLEEIGRADAAGPADDLTTEVTMPHQHWAQGITKPAEEVVLDMLESDAGAARSGFTPRPSAPEEGSRVRSTLVLAAITITVVLVEILLQEQGSQALFGLSDTKSFVFAVIVPLMAAAVAHVGAYCVLTRWLGHTRLVKAALLAVIATSMVMFIVAIATGASEVLDTVSLDAEGFVNDSSGWLTILRIAAYVSILALGTAAIFLGHLTFGWQHQMDLQQLDADRYRRVNGKLSSAQVATVLEGLVRLQRALMATQIQYQRAYYAGVVSALDPTVKDHWDASSLLAAPAEPAWVERALQEARDLRSH
jgi:hypothetical protein